MRDQGGVQCTAWRLLDAQFWGVPQRRKRIYLVNDFGNGRAGQILFECESVLGYHSQGGAEEQGNSGNSENSLTGTDCRGMAEDADGQMKLDFGRTADRIYINAKTSVTLMGNAGNMETLMDAEVKRFRPTPEIRHKEWQKRGLMAPLQPQETPEYSFSDLQMNLYNTIYL